MLENHYIQDQLPGGAIVLSTKFLTAVRGAIQDAVPEFTVEEERIQLHAKKVDDIETVRENIEYDGGRVAPLVSALYAYAFMLKEQKKPRIYYDQTVKMLAMLHMDYSEVKEFAHLHSKDASLVVYVEFKEGCSYCLTIKPNQ